MQYKKPKHPGDLLRKAQGKKKKSAMAFEMKTPTVGLPKNPFQAKLRSFPSQSALAGSFKTLKKKKSKSGKGKHKKNWIARAIKHPGALHRELGVKAGHKIPAKTLTRAAGKSGKLGRRARLAETLKGLHKKKGGKHSVHHKKGTMCKGC